MEHLAQARCEPSPGAALGSLSSVALYSGPAFGIIIAAILPSSEKLS